MYTGQIGTISNKATWQSDVIEMVDESDGSTVDLGDAALTVDIVVTIKSLANVDSGETTALATASIANGKVAIVTPGFQWTFAVSDLTSLSAGAYRVGAKITIDDFVTDLIVGNISVIEGN